MSAICNQQLRLCKVLSVEGQLGYFHCWEQYSTVIEPSPLIGGHPGGTISQVYGIVEFPDGIHKVIPTDIVFCDDKNAELNTINKMYKEAKE